MTKQELVQYLKNLGIELHVSACGCCDSPWVKIIHNGEVLVEEDCFNLYEDDYKEKTND